MSFCQRFAARSEDPARPSQTRDASRKIAVAMRDSHGDSRLVCAFKWETTKVIHVAVKNIVRFDLIEQSSHCTVVLQQVTEARRSQKFAPQFADFCIVVPRAGLMDEKIHLKPRAIDTAEDVHQPRFDPGSVHPRHDLEYSHARRWAAGSSARQNTLALGRFLLKLFDHRMTFRANRVFAAYAAARDAWRSHINCASKCTTLWL